MKLGSLCIALVATLGIAPSVATAAPSPHRSGWAYVEQATAVYNQPDTQSRRVGKLRLKTEDRTDELVSVIQEQEVEDTVWMQIRFATRSKRNVGWVPEHRLDSVRYTSDHLRINRSQFTIRLTRQGKTIFRARIGVGKTQWPTPQGQFYIRNKITSFRASLYGPVAFGTSAKSSVLTDWPGGGVIGIHGTNRPGLLPGRVSHGCIRLKNKDILRLNRLLQVGTPITIK